MINLSNYSTFILDFDGVILDSNSQKEINIFKSLDKHKNLFSFDECLDFFNSNPGISRTKKLKKFIDDDIILNKILTDYKKENYKTLFDCRLVEGVSDFLKKNKKNQLILLSGSEDDELKDVIVEKKIDIYFDFICGSIKSKIEHLNELKLGNNILFFGDSKYDNAVAHHFDIDFVFVNGYTKIKSNDLQYNFIAEITNFKGL